MIVLLYDCTIVAAHVALLYYVLFTSSFVQSPLSDTCSQFRFVSTHHYSINIDMVAEARMYNLLQDMGRKHVLKNGEMTAPGLNFISVGHRPSLLAFHDKRLRLNGEDKPSIENIEKSALNTEQTVKNVSNL